MQHSCRVLSLSLSLYLIIYRYIRRIIRICISSEYHADLYRETACAIGLNEFLLSYRFMKAVQGSLRMKQQYRSRARLKGIIKLL